MHHRGPNIAVNYMSRITGDTKNMFCYNNAWQSNMQLRKNDSMQKIMYSNYSIQINDTIRCIAGVLI